MLPIRFHGEKKTQSERRSTLRSSRLPKQHTSLSDVRTRSEKLPRTSKATSPRPLSFLERLPTEIIELVFFGCLNVNIPRASPILASALSSFYVKSRLFFEAFSSDYRVLQYERKLLSIFFSFSDIADLQTSIVGLKWMTLDFLHQCLPLFLEKVWLSHSTVHGLKAIEDPPPSHLSNQTAANFIDNMQQANDLDEPANFYPIRSAQRWYGNKNLSIGIGLPDGWVSVHSTRSQPIWLQRRFLLCKNEMYDLVRCLIPEKLLHRPWSPERCDLLEALTLNGATIGTCEEEKSALQQALEGHSVRALRILTNSYHGGLVTKHSRSKSEAPSPTSFVRASPMMFVRVGLGVSTTKKDLRAAALIHDSSLEILKIIYEAIESTYGEFDPPSRLDKADKPLFAWAKKMHRQGDPRGTWLKSKFMTAAVLESRFEG